MVPLWCKSPTKFTGSHPAHLQQHPPQPRKNGAERRRGQGPQQRLPRKAALRHPWPGSNGRSTMEIKKKTTSVESQQVANHIIQLIPQRTAIPDSSPVAAYLSAASLLSVPRTAATAEHLLLLSEQLCRPQAIATGSGLLDLHWCQTYRMGE